MTKQSKSLGLNFGRGTMFKKGGKGVEGVRKRKRQAEWILMLKTSYQTSNRDFQYWQKSELHQWLQFWTRGQIPTIFEKKNSVLEKKHFAATPVSIVGSFKVGIKENIYRIMKDCLVDLFLSFVGRAPFDGVKERWTFWSLSEIKAANFRRWCFDQRTHSAKLWKTLVTRSFPNTIRTPLERIYLQFHNVIDWNEFFLLIVLRTHSAALFESVLCPLCGVMSVTVRGTGKPVWKSK